MFPRQKQNWPWLTPGRAGGQTEPSGAAADGDGTPDAARRIDPGRPKYRRAFLGARLAAGVLLAAMLAVPTTAPEAGEQGLLVDPTEIIIDEGERGKISVALKTQPTGLVTVRISRDSVDGFAMDRLRMQFTPETWNQPQSVWLRARLDDDATDETTIFTFTPRGGDYGGVAPVSVTARVKDYEGHAQERGLVIDPTEITIEEGGKGKISVSLKSRPKSMVAVSISQNPADTFAVKNQIMRFTTENWDRPQLLWLPAPEDDDTVDETAVFTFAPRRGGYNGLAPVTVTARVEDNDDVPVLNENFPTVSIADASADEDNASRDIFFEVSLSEPADRLAAVEFRTVPGGTATVGADYRNERYTVFIPAGKTTALAGVQIFDDDIDDDGETLIVEISNARLLTWPRGRRTGLDIEDSRAIGTIRNSDPLPKDWLARFGRTVAEQVVEAVQGRFRAPGTRGAQMTLAGERIDGEAAANMHEGRRPAFEQRPITSRDALLGTSFSLAGETAEGRSAAVWGRGAVTRFDGQGRVLGHHGEVESAMLGIDWSGTGWTAGLLSALSRGTGGHSGDREVKTESSIVGVYPYGRYALNDRITLWGVAGYGRGNLSLMPEQGGPRARADVGLGMAAAGIHGLVMTAPESGGAELAATGDALFAKSDSEAVTGSVAAAEAGVSRFRIGLEGAWLGLGDDANTVVPRLEVGLRKDGGDAETGLGADMGASLSWSNRESGIAAELGARRLVAHDDEAFREESYWGSLTWDPEPVSERGPRLTVRQSTGPSVTGGAGALLSGSGALSERYPDGGTDEHRWQRTEVRLGFGLPALGNGFTSVPEIGLGIRGSSREYSLSWRLASARPGSVPLEFGLHGTRTEDADEKGNPEHGVAFEVRARW